MRYQLMVGSTTYQAASCVAYRPWIRFAHQKPESSLTPSATGPTREDYEASRQRLKTHGWGALKNMAWFAALPLGFHFGLDRTGITDAIRSTWQPLSQIIGHEGFGHAGLCFALHYLIKAGSHVKALISQPIIVMTKSQKTPTEFQSQNNTP